MAEKTLAEIPRPIRELYERGIAAWQRQNWDYAIAIFTQVLLKEPAFYECREYLRACQHKKSGAGVGFFKRFIGTASISPLLAKGQITLRTNKVEALNIAEQILNIDPDNVNAHKLLAEAAISSDLPRTAALSLEIAHKHSPKDKDISLRLGEALVRSGQIAKAESVCRELEQLYPNDPVVTQALKDVVAQRSMVEGGYQALSSGQGSYRDILKDKAAAVSLEQEKREFKGDDITVRLIQEFEARIPNEPGNLGLLRSIAELYANRKEFDRALEYYNRILQTEGANDPSLERIVAETTSRKFDHALSQLDPTLPDYEAQAAKIKADKISYRIAEAQKRVEKYPTDLQLRFDLGQLWFEAGKLNEAIQEFQRAQANPNIRIAALSRLGQCFSRRGMHDLAARTFQNAIKEKVVFDEEKKDLIYQLGSVLETMAKKEEAIEQFKQIYQADIGYRDVAAKVDNYYSSR
jgi:tetratricopeptide (TPR) repeat protein